MVGHDDPFQKPVAFSVKASPVVDDDGGEVGPTEEASARALVHVLFQKADSGEALFFMGEVADLPFGAGDDPGGKGVGETVGDELGSVGGVEMGEVAAVGPEGGLRGVGAETVHE